MLDLDRARRETPGCAHVTHFNNAGAALVPNVVLETVIDFLKLEANTGSYEATRARKLELEAVYSSAAKLLECLPEEIAIVENATRGWDMAFYGVPFRAGDRVLTAQAEYGSNLIAYQQVSRQRGISVEVIPNDEHGQVSIEALDQMMDERVRLVAITHVPTNSGLVNPAAQIGAIAKKWGALFLLDACQSVGQMPLSVNELHCDMLSATSRKYLRGPRGVGLLYVRREVLDQLEPPFLDVHAATLVAPDRYEMLPSARRFENWESNIAAKLGFGAAIDYAHEWGLEAIWERVSALARGMRARLSAIPGVQVRDVGQVQCGIVSFTAEGWDAESLRQELLKRHVNVNRSGARSTILDMQARGLEEVVRASVHYYNSEDEIDEFCSILAALSKEVAAR